MADNTNPQHITFSKEWMRPLANVVEGDIRASISKLRKFASEWVNKGYSGSIPNDGEKIADGAQITGGPISLNSYAHLMASKSTAMADALEAALDDESRSYAFKKLSNLPFGNE